MGDYNTYSEVKCGIGTAIGVTGNKITIKASIGAALAFSGIGILSACDCSKTSLDYS